MILYFFFCVDSDYLCEGFVPVCQILTDNKTAAFPESVSGLIPAEYSQDDIANFFRFQGIDRVINKKNHELLSPTVLRNNKMVYEATAFVMPKKDDAHNSTVCSATKQKFELHFRYLAMLRGHH